MPLLFDHFIVAVLLPAGVRLSERETCLGIHAERRERIENRRGLDVEPLDSEWHRARNLYSGFLRDRWHGFILLLRFVTKFLYPCNTFIVCGILLGTEARRPFSQEPRLIVPLKPSMARRAQRLLPRCLEQCGSTPSCHECERRAKVDEIGAAPRRVIPWSNFVI